MTGSGWKPGEKVTLYLHEDPQVEANPVLTTTVDANGNINDSTYAPNIKDLGIRYYMTAVGSASGLQAQTTFTDSQNLTVTISPTGGGTVKSEGLTINCPTTCNANEPSGSSITLTAANSTGYRFDHWTSNSSTYGCNGSTNNVCGPWNIPSGTNTLNITAYFGPTILAITSISPTSPQAASGFSVTVQAQANGAATNVLKDTGVTLSLSSGTGTLGGTLTGTIVAGAGSVTITGVTYTKAESGVKLTAAASGGDSLTAATSSAFTVTGGAVNATHSTMSASPASVVADGVTTSTITVTLKDVNDNPASGKTVTLAQGSGSSTISAASGSSSATGVVTFTVKDTKAEAVTYTARDTTDSVTITPTAAVTFFAGAVSATHSTVSGSPASVVADGTTTSTITVTLKDANNNPASGKAVTLAQGSGSSTVSTASGASNASGVVTFTVRDTKAEAVTYMATDTTDSVTITPTAGVTFTAGAVNATHSTMSASPASVLADGTTTSTITVTLKDVNNNPASGKTVTLAQGSGSSTISTASGASNASGVVTFTVKDTKAEAVTYTATDTTDSVTITPTAGVTFTAVPTTLALAAPNPASVTYGSSGPMILSATLTQTSGGAAVVGATVTFTVDGSSVGTAVTDATGVAAISTYNPSALTATTHNVQASSALQTISSGTFGASTSAMQTLTVSQAAITPILVNLSLSQTYDGTQKSVTVSSVAAVTVTYTGISPTVYGPDTNPPTNPGNYSVAVLVVDANYTGSASGTLVISQLDAGLNLALPTGAPATTPYGTRAYFELATASSVVCPTGTVNFYVDYQDNSSQPAYTFALNGTTRPDCAVPVEFQIATMTVGPHAITAVYSGDTYYQSATSNALTQVVTADGTAVTLATSGTSVNVGDALTLTATVTPSMTVDQSASAPAGTVNFNEVDSGGTLLSVLGSVPLAGTTAVYSTSSLPAGPHNVQAVFVDADGQFQGTSTVVPLGVTVNLRVPVITWTPNVATILYGTPLSSDQLNASAADPEDNSVSVDGSFSYVPASGSVQGVGSPQLQVTFTPTDGTKYTTNTATTTITVTPAMLTVTASSATVNYGDAVPTITPSISGFVSGENSSVVTTQPTCTATYTPTSNAGSTQTTSCVGGMGSNNYSFTYVPGTVTVNPAALTVTAVDKSKTYDGSAFSAFTVSYSGLVNNEDATVLVGAQSFSGSAVSATSAGAYTIMPGGLTSTNYAITFNTGTLTINKATPTVIWSTPPAITYGTALSVTQLNATAIDVSGSNLLGTFAYTPATATMLTAGTQTLSVTFTPTDTTDYATATKAVSITVVDFSLPSTPPTLAVAAGQTNTAPFIVAPITGFVGTVSFTCSVPASMSEASCSASSVQVTGVTGASSTLTVNTTGAHHVASIKHHDHRLMATMGTLFAGFFWFGIPAVRRRRFAILALVLTLLLVLGIASCGGSSGGNNTSSGHTDPGTPAGTYTLTLTATSGTATHTMNVTATVQ